MNVSFRTKLLASHVGLVAIVVLAIILELNRSLGADLERQLDVRLEQTAKGAAAWVGEGRRHPDKLAGRIALIVHARVTIFSADGEVLGDSADETSPSLAMLDQPEVRVAQTGAVGRANRVTATGENTHFVAVLATDGIVLRLGEPLANIETTLRAMRWRLLVASCLAVLIALGLGTLASRIAARPLRAMTATATAIARGQYEMTEPSSAPDDFGVLSRTLSDLAAQLKAQVGALTSERDRLSAILAGMAEGVIVMGEDGLVVLANPAAAEMFGRAREDLTGRPLSEAVLAPDIVNFMQRAWEKGETSEGELEAGHGLERTGRSIAIYARPFGGGVIAVLRDMTHVRRLLSLRRDFVANVSHELRTPVTAIQGYAETLLRGNVDEPTARQFLEIVFRHAKRIGALVEGLLRLSELDAKPLEEAAPRETVELDAVVRQLRETVGERLGSAGVALKAHVPPGLSAWGDPMAIEQVLENLVDNAIKYGRPSGTIEISAEDRGARVSIAVADDGPGIEAHHLPRLFERFYRVDQGRSRERGGTGLGLAIVKHLVEAMSGTIEVRSSPGEGTVFRVELPRPPTTEPSAG